MWTAGVLLLALAAAQLGALEGRAPSDLGGKDGLLKAPSFTRNSVSSQTDRHPGHPLADYARIDPLPFRPGGAEASMNALVTSLQQLGGARVVEQRADYLRAEARTPWLGFVDDLEFLVDPQRGVIDLRSASRLGSEDFGTNRRRIDDLRAIYLRQP
jgi:uncharacterized protein (DUF1499 family)